LEKKQALINSAIKLFARNGFDATSTASIGIHAGVTEPLIHYHFKNKDGLFTYILDTIFSEYFSRFDALPIDTDTEFEKLANLINFHFQFADDLPDETHIIVRACPAKLQDAAHTCTQYVSDQRKRLSEYVSTCLETPSQVRDFRGAMQGRADKGIIITTGRFTRDAKAEACRDGVTPIEIVDGSKLVEMFELHELGLNSITTYDIDHGFFDEFRD